MDVKQIPIDKIKPYEKNAKKHPEEQVDQIANSLKEFGWQQPIVLDKDNVVVIGHGRLLAAKQLGMTEAPVVYAEGLTDKQIKALRIADNKISENGGWDNELLKEDLLDLIDDIDMTDFGFGDFELSMLTEDFEPEPYDDDMAEKYSERENEFLAKERVIITYAKEDVQKVAELLGIDEIKRVVYDINDLGGGE